MFEVVAITTRGIRKKNEDCLVVGNDIIQKDYQKFVTTMNEGYLAVLDGMGGLARGDEASLTGAEALVHNSSLDLHTVIQQCNEAVCRKQNFYHSSMATTIAGIYLKKDASYQLFNAGDSMIYIYNSFIRPISRSDTPIDEFKRLGIFMEGNTNEVTEYLGKNKVKPFITDGKLYADEIILICSDGLCKSVNYEKMEDILSEDSLEEMGMKLLSAAEYSDDNITLILVREVKENG